MKNKKEGNIRNISIILAPTLIILSMILYYQKSPFWFNPAVIGFWLLFDNISYSQNNKTTLDLIINKNYKKFLDLYVLLILLAVFIEGTGSLLLQLWSYPKLWNFQPLSKLIIINIIGYLFYPFIFMSFKEMYSFLLSIFKNNIISIALATLLSIIIWEIPNNSSIDWIYKVPFINLEIANINVFIIATWMFLILIPIYIYKYLNIRS